MSDTLVLLAGIVVAALGGEVFVRGIVGLAGWARVPIGIAGVTLAAFATSAPELSVAVNSAIEGSPEVAAGTALGSNVINVALILGLALMISGIRVPRESVKRDYGVALANPVVVGVMILDGTISRLEGGILLAMFVGWVAVVTRDALRARYHVGEWDRQSPPRLGIYVVVGLVLLTLAGRWIVDGATGVAGSLGLTAFVIGAAIVSIGTSVPELATTLISKLRGHDEIGLGNVLGSNIFNGFWIVGIAAVITPIHLAAESVAVTLAFGIVTMGLCFPIGDGFLRRKRGFVLLLVWIIYMVSVVAVGETPGP